MWHQQTCTTGASWRRLLRIVCTTPSCWCSCPLPPPPISLAITSPSRHTPPHLQQACPLWGGLNCQPPPLTRPERARPLGWQHKEYTGDTQWLHPEQWYNPQGVVQDCVGDLCVTSPHIASLIQPTQTWWCLQCCITKHCIPHSSHHTNYHEDSCSGKCNTNVPIEIIR